MRPSRRGTIIVAAACLLGSPLSATAGTPSPNLDTTFGAGVVREDFEQDDTVRALAVDADGRVVVAIASRTGGDPGRLVVARYTSAGVRDTTFGPNGDGTIDIPPGDPDGSLQSSTAIAIRDDGKIVVAGGVRYSSPVHDTLLVARLGTDGTLDDTSDADPTISFSGDGVFETDVETGFVSDLALQANGRIVVVGRFFDVSTDDASFDVMRVTAAGVLDPSWDGVGAGNGLVQVSFGDGPSQASEVEIAPTGEIVVAGTFRPAESIDSRRFALARLRAANGTLDPTFDDDGRRLRPLGDEGSGAAAVSVFPDGRIIAAGFATQSGESVMAFAQFRADGSNDPSFGTAGVVMVDVAPGGFDSLRAMERTAAGRIVATGAVARPGSGSAVGVLRLDPDGTLDPSLDGDGKATFIWSRSVDQVATLGLGGGGRIVLGGSVSLGELRTDAVLSRLLASGAPDQAFGPAGTVSIPLHSNDSARDSARGVAVDPNGRIVAAGIAEINDERRFGVVRLLRTGLQDITFAGDGQTTVDFGAGDDQANDVAVTPSGQLIAVGCRACDGTAPDIAVAKLRADGTPDTAFSLDGQTVTAFGPGLSEVANAVALQSDGRILVAGTVDGDFGLVRYRANGTRDVTFSDDGRVRTDLGSGSVDAAHGVFIQVDGRVNVVGSRKVGQATRFAIVRYLANGRLDSSFGGDGIVITRVGANESGAVDVTGDAQGRLVVVGDAFTGSSTSPRLALARYLPNGRPDDTFSGDGQRTDLFGTDAALGRGVVVQPNGRIVVGGSTLDVTGTGLRQQMLIARYTDAGALDASFGSNGHDTAFPPGPDADAQGLDLVREPGGRLVLVGDVEYVDDHGVSEAFAFARFDQ